MKTQTRWSYCKFLAVTLLVGSFLPLASRALADGTTAGTTISNTATATYEDPNAPGTIINATSNTVTVTVAEVAGVTATPLAINDLNGGTVLPNDVLNYDFRLTNVGNDPTGLFIPGSATVTGPGTGGALQFSIDGGTTFNPVPAGGVTTASIPAGGSVIVRVPVTISGLASSGSTVAVRLGDTGLNDNSAATQNQPDATDGSLATEIRTVDNVDGTANEAAGAPSNGERETSATQQVLVGAQPQAFAAILKTRTAYTDSSTTALNDDVLTYGLSLRVDATAPSGTTGLSPANLEGTTINVDGAAVVRVLVSDAVPVNTTLTGTPVAPTGWTIVYTNSPTGTNANAANWVTTVAAIGGIANATRIGFINNGSIPAGTTVTGFTFQVVTTGVTATTTIANLAQVFGQTAGGGTTLVYDESGDQTPSNFNDDGTPGSNTPTNGVTNPAVDGVDSNNNNTGTGPGGEDNVFTVAAAGTILNGPNGQPAAVGPTNNNDDFTNRSSTIPANTAPGSTIDPNAVTFLNTINNPTTGSLSNILLVPDAANFTPGAGEVLPPTGTTVTLTYGGQTAVYTFNGTNFIFTSGSTIVIPTLTAGTSVNYSVAVDLPANTALSTDTGNGFSIPIFAFQDVNGNGRPDLVATEPTQNRSIDRVYTGFLRVVKDARILETDGTTVVENYTQTPTPANLRVGRFIEYRITYTNVSIAPVGAGNVTLSAGNVIITEDGTTGTNTWARDNDTNGVIDTSNIVGSTTAQFGTIAYAPSGDQSGTTQPTDVTRYTNTLGIAVQPGASGTFIFRRRIN
ncbi:MAG: beta strand repeat-containing protein [Stenomitos frigidus ULC029]